MPGTSVPETVRHCRGDTLSGAGPVAQRSEQRTHNPLVPGSNPGGPICSRMVERETHACVSQVCRRCLNCASGADLRADLGPRSRLAPRRRPVGPAAYPSCVRSPILGGGRVAGILFSAFAVAAVTGAIFGLRTFAPVLSLGVLYIFAVLAVAIGWGLAYAVPVSIASMLAFNFFFLPPIHTLALSDSENWFALAVYLVTAVVVSELAARARRRAFEAEEREREAAELAERTVEAEALRRSDAAKTALLRAVSHDLRSPLTAIRAAAEGLENTAFRLGSARACRAVDGDPSGSGAARPARRQPPRPLPAGSRCGQCKSGALVGG